MSAERLRPLPWQQDVWLDLTTQVLQGQLAHAMLMSGPAGVGKRWLARALAAFVLCEQRSGYACGQCRSCVQFAAGSQPNAAWVGTAGHLGLSLDPNAPVDRALVHWEPDRGSKQRDIAIGAVQSLIARLGQSSHYGQARVVIIDPADLLNESSVNALLKLVEEPPQATYLWLISERPGTLRATLRSRCQRLRLNAPDTDVALSWLQAREISGDVEATLEASGGAPLRALELADGDALAQRQAWSELWLGLARRRLDPVSAAGQIGREEVDEHLAWAWRWLFEQFGNRVADGLEPGAAEAWEQVLSQLGEMRRRLRGNAQPQLLVESLFVLWMRAAPRALGLR